MHGSHGLLINEGTSGTGLITECVYKSFPTIITIVGEKIKLFVPDDVKYTVRHLAAHNGCCP